MKKLGPSPPGLSKTRGSRKATKAKPGCAAPSSAKHAKIEPTTIKRLCLRKACVIAQARGLPLRPLLRRVPQLELMFPSPAGTCAIAPTPRLAKRERSVQSSLAPRPLAVSANSHSLLSLQRCHRSLHAYTHGQTSLALRSNLMLRARQGFAMQFPHKVRVDPSHSEIDLRHGEIARSGASVPRSSAGRRLANTMILHTVQNSMSRTELHRRAAGISRALLHCCGFLVCTAKSSLAGNCRNGIKSFGEKLRP